MRYIILCAYALSILFTGLFFTTEIQNIDVHVKSIICIEPYHDYVYKTCAPITYSIDSVPLTVPKFYETDLASIPRAFWNITSPARSEFMSAAILHDFLYSCHNGLSRKEIDNIFFNLLVENGVSKEEALFFYVGIRVFGSSHFQGGCKWRIKH